MPAGKELTQRFKEAIVKNPKTTEEEHAIMMLQTIFLKASSREEKDEAAVHAISIGKNLEAAAMIAGDDILSYQVYLTYGNRTAMDMHIDEFNKRTGQSFKL